jgi:hypothetical protein
MNRGTDNITPEKPGGVSDPRFDMRMTENFGDDNEGGTGWVWVAAILIAGALIVSGFLDQESRDFDGNTASRTVQSYPTSAKVPATVLATVNSMDHRSTKGY